MMMMMMILTGQLSPCGISTLSTHRKARRQNIWEWRQLKPLWLNLLDYLRLTRRLKREYTSICELGLHKFVQNYNWTLSSFVAVVVVFSLLSHIFSARFKLCFPLTPTLPASRNSFLVRAPDSWSEGCEFESRQERRENFHLQSYLSVQTLIRCPFQPVLPQWHVKDPCHSVKTASDRLRLNTHTPLTQRSRNGLTMPLSKLGVLIYSEMSSHATCQGTFSHSRLSSLSLCGLTVA